MENITLVEAKGLGITMFVGDYIINNDKQITIINNDIPDDMLRILFINNTVKNSNFKVFLKDGRVLIYNNNKHISTVTDVNVIGKVSLVIIDSIVYECKNLLSLSKLLEMVNELYEYGLCDLNDWFGKDELQTIESNLNIYRQIKGTDLVSKQKKIVDVLNKYIALDSVRAKSI